MRRAGPGRRGPPEPPGRSEERRIRRLPAAMRASNTSLNSCSPVPHCVSAIVMLGVVLLEIPCDSVQSCAKSPPPPGRPEGHDDLLTFARRGRGGTTRPGGLSLPSQASLKGLAEVAIVLRATYWPLPGGLHRACGWITQFCSLVQARSGCACCLSPVRHRICRGFSCGCV